MKQNLKTIAALGISALLSSVCATGASASTILFQGQNAGLFPGANPADTSALMNSVVKPSNNPRTPSSTLTTQNLILDSVASQISNQINNIIFNNANPSGSFNLGGGTLISFTRGGGLLTIHLTDPIHGETVITIPDV